MEPSGSEFWPVTQLLLRDCLVYTGWSDKTELPISFLSTINSLTYLLIPSWCYSPVMNKKKEHLLLCSNNISVYHCKYVARCACQSPSIFAEVIKLLNLVADFLLDHPIDKWPGRTVLFSWVLNCDTTADSATTWCVYKMVDWCVVLLAWRPGHVRFWVTAELLAVYKSHVEVILSEKFFFTFSTTIV